MTMTEDDVDVAADEPPKSLALLRTQRSLQIILGLFWLLDAGLQFQPFMFGKGFTTTYLLNNAQGQPAVISWIITNVGHFVGPHVAVWNTFFALIQVAIGGGLLFRRTVRRALVVSFFWAFSVWFFGEGLGLLLSGSASALTGAPGSVFIYGLLGVMAWPRTTNSDAAASTEGQVGIASSAAGRGLGGQPPLYWSGAAIGRWRQCSFCCPRIELPHRYRARSSACRQESRAGTHTFSTVLAPILAMVASRRRGSSPLRR